MMYEKVRLQYDPSEVIQGRNAVEVFLNKLEMALSDYERGLLVKDHLFGRPESRVRRWFGKQDNYLDLVVGSENGLRECADFSSRCSPLPSKNPVDQLMKRVLSVEDGLHPVKFVGDFYAVRKIHVKEEHFVYQIVERMRGLEGLSLFEETYVGRFNGRLNREELTRGEQVCSVADVVRFLERKRLIGMYVREEAVGGVDSGYVRYGRVNVSSEGRMCVSLVSAPLDVILRVRRVLLDRYVFGGFDVHHSYQQFDLSLEDDVVWEQAEKIRKLTGLREKNK